ncbi:MAG TPA: SpoIIE family protein phosphatase [Terriglobales bacterium]|nr:SpoIIE family protein phosphatase [Terriglobales bacterium]
MTCSTPSEAAVADAAHSAFSGEATTAVRAKRVLVADDQADVLHAIALLLKSEGFESKTVMHPAAVVEAIQASDFDLLIMDLNYTLDTTSGTEGLDLISSIRKLDTAVPVLVITAWGTIELAVEALQRGASDFIQKPWTNAQLVQKARDLIQRAESTRKARVQAEEEQQESVEIQRKLLSLKLPEQAGLTVSGDSRSMRYVGGDYCHLTPLTASKFAVSIADVAGKGVPGALLTASLRGLEKSFVTHDVHPQQLCSSLNDALTEIMPLGKFVSFFFAVIDTQSRTLCYSNAGHNPPVLARADGSVLELRTGGGVLGLFQDWTYEQTQLKLQSGDRLALYTDGITEAESPYDEEFGAARVREIVAANRHASAQEIQRALMQAVSTHCEDRFQDDATIVVIAVE